MGKEEDMVMEVSPIAGELRQPARKSVRRRLIQSTLFAPKPQGVEANVDLKAEKNCEDGEEDEVEECPGSQKKRKPKGKTTPQSKKPRKPREKQTTTPRKYSKANNVSNGVSLSRLTAQMGNGDASPPIPNLRLEAKLTAEENIRMFAGRQIHPFFSSCNAGKKQHSGTDIDGNMYSSQKKDRNIMLDPIHVFDRSQDEDVMLNWSNWTFDEKIPDVINYGPEETHSSLLKVSTKSLQFDKFLSVSHLSSVSNIQSDNLLNQCLVKKEPLETSATLPLKSADKEVFEVGGNGSFSGDAGSVRKSNLEQQNRFLRERMMLYCNCCGNQPEDNLWTAKYQPRKAIEVCGNDESVKVLSEWLHLWHERDFKSSKGSNRGDDFIVEDDDSDYYESDCDSKNVDEHVKNVLLVTGPAGSGKSAAIYACAKEQGFTVLESNASEFRNGAAVRKLEEALHSHLLERSPRKLSDTHSKQTKISFPTAPSGQAAEESGNKVIELISLSDEASHNDIATSKEFVLMESGRASRPLILFEDVDITFQEDRGFLSAIQQIAEKGKGPIILTSNSNNPALPGNLERLEVCFTMPSVSDLLHHAHMVCAAEKVDIQHCLLQQLIGGCQGDIRKTIMHLQFWCQGSRHRKDWELHTVCGPLFFDLEAGHQLLPKILPFDFPSQLSEMVEKEIRMSLYAMDENSKLRHVGLEEKIDEKEICTGVNMHSSATGNLEAKKEAMLSRNYSVHGANEFGAPFNANCDFPDSSGTPIAFSRRSFRRKLDTVFSSDSDEDVCNAQCPEVPVHGNGTSNDVFLDTDNRSPSHYLEPVVCLSPLQDKQPCSEVQMLEDCQIRVTDNDLYNNYMCKSVDISWVPESSFVPETEMDDGTETLSGVVFTSPGTYAAEEVSPNYELSQNLFPIKANNLIEFGLAKSPMGDTGDVIAESSPSKVVSSQTEHVEGVTRRYQVMDECSRMDFDRRSNLIDEPRLCQSFVQGSWQKLRNSHTHLSQYVASEPRDAIRILNLSSGMCNLISEVDLLLSNRHRDTLEPSVVHSEESDTFGWYEDQSMMTSTIAQHGFCSYAEDISVLGSEIGCPCAVDLALEMLNYSRDTALHKLSRRDMRTHMNPIKDLDTRSTKIDTSLKSETKECIFDMIQSVVPSRSYLALKSNAFHEYLSSLGHISRSEASRLSDSIGKTRRRRSRRNYLSALALSPEGISMVGKCNLYGKSILE